jgi:glycine oxidase
MLAPYVEAHQRTPMLDLCLRSLDLYDAWIAALRGESAVAFEYRRIGTLEIALEADRAAQLRASVHRPSDVVRTWLDPEETRRQYPALTPAAGALFTPSHGYVDPQGLAAALMESAMSHGASVHVATVQRIDRDGDRFHLATAAGTFAADAVVLTAGAWTNAIEGVRTPPVRPVRGQLLHLEWQGEPLSAILWGPRCYIVPRTDGRMLVGATVEEVGFDGRRTAAAVRDLLDAACELLPEAANSTFIEARAGFRPATPDDLPAIGPDPDVPGLVHATGHYRNGVLLAPITARLIADWIVDGKRDAAFDAFNPGRF